MSRAATDERRIHVRPHAIRRFMQRWRPELAERDARRELYHAVMRSVRIEKIDGGVLYETDDQERIPLVIREHKMFGQLVVTVLPAHARSIGADDLEDLGVLGRIGTPAQPAEVERTTAAGTPISRSGLTPTERFELAKIEWETALLVEAIERMKFAEQPRIISELRARIVVLEEQLRASSPPPPLPVAPSASSPPIAEIAKLRARIVVLEGQIKDGREARVRDRERHTQTLKMADREGAVARRALRALLLASRCLSAHEPGLRRAIEQIELIEPGFLSRGFLHPESMTKAERRAEAREIAADAGSGVFPSVDEARGDDPSQDRSA